MKDTVLVFVYGTLRTDLRKIHDLWKGLPTGKFISNGTIVGQLYKLSEAVPGVKLSGTGKVVGEVVQVTPDELVRFDRLEGHPNNYRREEVPVTLSDGTTLTAWVYGFPFKYGGDEAKNLIKSGDWKKQYEKFVRSRG